MFDQKICTSSRWSRYGVRDLSNWQHIKNKYENGIFVIPRCSYTIHLPTSPITDNSLHSTAIYIICICMNAHIRAIGIVYSTLFELFCCSCFAFVHHFLYEYDQENKKWIKIKEANKTGTGKIRAENLYIFTTLAIFYNV